MEAKVIVIEPLILKIYNGSWKLTLSPDIDRVAAHQTEAGVMSFWQDYARLTTRGMHPRPVEAAYLNCAPAIDLYKMPV